MSVDPDLVVGSVLSLPLFREVVAQRRDNRDRHDMGRDSLYPYGEDPLGFAEYREYGKYDPEEQAVVALRALATEPVTAQEALLGDFTGDDPTLSDEFQWLLTGGDFTVMRDEGLAMGEALSAATTATGPLTADAAHLTNAFVQFAGTAKLDLPTGMEQGMREMLTHWVDAVNWYTSNDKTPPATRLRDESSTTNRVEVAMPNFLLNPLSHVMKESFTTEVTATGFAAASIWSLHQDFLAVAAHGDEGAQQSVANQTGQMFALHSDTFNHILENGARNADERAAAQRAFGEVVLEVAYATPVVGNTIEGAVSGVPAALQGAATTGSDRAQDGVAGLAGLRQSPVS